MPSARRWSLRAAGTWLREAAGLLEVERTQSAPSTSVEVASAAGTTSWRPPGPVRTVSPKNQYARPSTTTLGAPSAPVTFARAESGLSAIRWQTARAATTIGVPPASSSRRSSPLPAARPPGEWVHAETRAAAANSAAAATGSARGIIRMFCNRHGDQNLTRKR
jgi:hypothetical protein